MFKLCACALLLCVFVSSASAVCMGPQPRLVCAEFFREQVVVTARLVRTRYVDPKRDDAMDYYLYTMQTDRVLRGRIAPRFRIYEENSSGRAGFGWNVGETYLLFLSYMKGDRAWELDGCGNSGPLRKSAEVLKEIDKIKTATDGGVIAGEVWFDPGVTVIVQGTGGTFRTQSDKESQFRVQVPAGVYSVRPVERGARFVADALSYELPRHVRIQNGSCAQIRFNREEPGERKQPSERPPGK
jgi:hypothetical protein